MAGLYLHIPFCKSRCIYCAFYSTTGMNLRQHYVDALCREMTLRPSNETIETVYLGGGTPSQLTPEQLEKLFLYINKVYNLSPDAEVTLEANPDDVTAEFGTVLQRLPVNRISMGIQTFNDQRLRFLHRRHTASQATHAVGILRNCGIRNISIDLMYGFPNETLDDWLHDIGQALMLDVEHLSAYCLTVEEETPLQQLLMNHHELMMPDEEQERQMYEHLTDCLTAAGYEHYEISNFAKPGFRSRHNSSYWHDVPYIGLGAAAHSYELKTRSWNVCDIQRYMESVESGLPCREEEPIDTDTHYNDLITTALRTSDGLDLTTLSDHYRSYCLGEARQFLDDGLLQQDGSRLVLTRRGLFVSDFIMSTLVIA